MSQAEFHAALFDPELPVPVGLIGPDGDPAPKRFAVYRNNVAVAMTSALETGFPVLRQLLGAEFFAAMAGIFWRAHPPKSRMMMHYGVEMPIFLSNFAPVAHLPYLPDVARYEIAMRRAYHAADALPIGAEILAALAPETLLGSRLTLAPALQLIRSAYPLHSIVQAQHTGQRPHWQAEDVLILRPEFDPVSHRLPAGGADFITAIAAGETISAAADCAGAAHDLMATLTLLLKGNAIIDVT